MTELELGRGGPGLRAQQERQTPLKGAGEATRATGEQREGKSRP